jgi:SAM-dependent methyltransferase
LAVAVNPELYQIPPESRCPLCGSTGLALFHIDDRRPYQRCPRCLLVSVPEAFHLSPEEERAEYERHENRIDDPGYRRFLMRAAEPLLARLPGPGTGLDFGCGPGPALAAMLRERGHSVTLFDPFFAPAPDWDRAVYDFITATEVVEHLAQPGAELERLWSLLREGGLLVVMTKLVRTAESFAGWHYRRDPTHIVFFSRATWRWWARQKGAALEFVGDDVIVLRRGERAQAR